ncbi:MAG: stage IV sporulation protein A [Christensenellales bacterium]
MEQFDLYQDIARRTNGEIYIGVVGPVRTGKSTFIKKFLDMMVLPKVENPYKRDRILDEMPQSGAGRGIMTMQPNFVPNEAVELTLDGSVSAKVRLVDCVGYLVEGATGQMDENGPRMVRTPWSEEDIPFEKAAEIGTKRVISEHSTIGVVVTTDGSITDIPRANYVASEERVVRELKALGKPFVLIVNSKTPELPEAKQLQNALQEKYGVPVVLCNIMQMSAQDMETLLQNILFEFPMKEIRITMPEWVFALSEEHWLMQAVMQSVEQAAEQICCVRDYPKMMQTLEECQSFNPPRLLQLQLGRGAAEIEMNTQPKLFYQVLGDECGTPIDGEYHLISLLKELVAAKNEYDRVAEALRQVRDTGYGVVQPSMDELTLEEPEIVRQGNRFGVRLKASAPSLHLMRVDIETEVSPIVGSERQSEELLHYLLSEFENDPGQIWATNIFGKSLHELVKEGLSNKLTRMPEEAQGKMQMTLQRIINEGRSNLICILF